MRGQAGFPVHVRPAGYARRQAGAPPGVRRISQVGLPFQRIDGRAGKGALVRSFLVKSENSRFHGGLSMSQIITKRPRLSRRTFLKGLTATQAPVMVGLPPLISMFNSTGTAYAADAKLGNTIGKRFVIWFNGNGIPERYWIPSNTGTDYDITPCLT